MAPDSLKIEEETVKSGDRWIWGIYIALCLISVVESYAALSQVVSKHGLYIPLVKHCGYLGMGFLILWGLQRLHYTKFIFGIKVFALLSLVCVILVLFIGKVDNGAARGLAIPHLGTIQPAEFAKLAIATTIPLIVSRNQIENGVSLKGAVLAVTVVCIFGGCLVPNGLTNTILLMFTSMVIMWVGGIKVKHLVAVFTVYAIFGGLIYKLYEDGKEKEALAKKIAQTEKVQDESAIAIAADQNNDKQTRAFRADTWFNRVERWKMNHDSLAYMPLTEKNKQEMYAHIAQANGGLYGVGPGRSRECSRLPLAYSDYIYSIIVEETGVLGGLLVMVLFLWLLVRAGLIASQCARALPALLIMGMAVMITFQALVHMAINTGLFPVSGQPLPLISEGGTSMWVMSAAFGIMLSVSRHASQNTIDKHNKKKNQENLPKEEQAPNPMQININNE
ncbi:MAG: FtsW/RodA/SpoVE family cell cycle protein [Muribaculaceae bacterium]